MTGGVVVGQHATPTAAMEAACSTAAAMTQATGIPYRVVPMHRETYTSGNAIVFGPFSVGSFERHTVENSLVVEVDLKAYAMMLRLARAQRKAEQA